MVNDNTRLTDDALAELARLAAATTPGWDRVAATVDVGNAPYLKIGVGPWQDGNYTHATEADVVFLETADPSTVAALVAEVRALRAATDELWRLALRAHVECDDCWYSCPKSEGGTCNEEWHDGECRCGADAHNARVASIRAALDGAE